MPDSKGDPSRSQPLSVLLVVAGYPPIAGGAETHVSRLAAALLRRGHRVSVLTLWAPPMPNATRWRDTAGVPVHAVGRTLPVRLRPRAFVLRVALTVLAGRRRYDVVQAFQSGLHGSSALLAGAVVGIPGAVMYGDPKNVPTLRKSRFGRLQLWSLRRLARRVVVLNDTMRADMLALGIAEDRIVAHPCSVDPEDFAPVPPNAARSTRARLAIPSDGPVVLFTGRFVVEKALPTLIEAFGMVRRSIPNAHLVLAGYGPLRDALETAARRFVGAEGVHFTDRLTLSEVRDYLQAADVYALISESEGIPCSLIEAMSCARPSVVSDAPGVVQLIDHEVHGLVVPVGDARATADALIRLLSDRALAERLGVAARARVLRAYSSDVVAANHETMYRAMIGFHASEHSFSSA